MSTYVSDIRAYLAGLLNAYQSTNVAWENVAFDPATPSYLQFAFSQSDAAPLGVGVSNVDVRAGIAQVNVYEPDGEGPAMALGKAEEVASVFKRGTQGRYNGTPVEVRRTVVGPPIQSNTHYVVPVTIYWQSVTEPVI